MGWKVWGILVAFYRREEIEMKRFDFESYGKY